MSMNTNQLRGAVLGMIALCGSGVSFGALAADTTEVRIEVGDCLALDDNFARLACYNAKAQAAAGAEVRVEVGDCVALTDNFSRLACFDARSRAAARSAPAMQGAAPTPASIPSAVPSTVVVDPVLGVPVVQGPEPRIVRQGMAETGATPGAGPDSFGLSQPEMIQRKGGKQELHDRIAALKENGDGSWTVTLASGQVWRQNGSQRYHLREGQEVRIYPSGWGDSYRLAVEELGGFIAVDRLR